LAAEYVILMPDSQGVSPLIDVQTLLGRLSAMPVDEATRERVAARTSPGRRSGASLPFRGR
jgi:hypothetical protein